MSTKTEIIANCKALADAVSVDALKDTFGTDGPAWVPEPKAFPILIEGLSDWLDAAGIGDMATVYAKVNEIITSLNQLITDYNSSTVPTTASSVTPLP